MTLEEMKTKYETGGYIPIASRTLGHNNPRPIWNYSYISNADKLIHVRHKEILDAYFANNEVLIGTNKGTGSTPSVYEDDFIGNYNEYWTYTLDQIAFTHSKESKEIENNFTKFGFEVPDFECEILKYAEDDGIYHGIVKVKDSFFSTEWNTKGDCVLVREDFDNIKYNLTPLKKNWWEEPDAFPCIIRTTEGAVIYDIAISFNNGCFVFNDTQRSIPNAWRCATNVEIDNLKH